MIYEHAYVTVAPESTGDFENAFAGAKKYLLDANDGKTAELIRSVDNPGLYLLRVGWDTVKDHTEVFAGSPNAEQFAQAVADFFVTTPQVVHFEAVSI